MPCRLDFAQLPMADNDRSAVLEAARILADHLPARARGAASSTASQNSGRSRCMPHFSRWMLRLGEPSSMTPQGSLPKCGECSRQLDQGRG